MEYDDDPHDGSGLRSSRVSESTLNVNNADLDISIT